MDNVAKIAAGLSEAQKRSILLFRWNRDKSALYCPRHRDKGLMHRSLHELGICSEFGRITTTGLAVRTYLKEAQNG